MLDQTIKEVIAKNKKEYKEILKAIEKYDDIVVFRHQMPDFDALGTQMGLVTWIKDNYPKKNVHYIGENHVTFTPRLYPKMEILDDEYFNNKFLAIVVDTGNCARISDGRYIKADMMIKIDHHPNVEPYGNVVLVNHELAAASELVTNMLVYFNKLISKNAAHYLYSGIVGDSGRFMYSSTTAHTFAVTKILIETGFDISQDVYQLMYLKQLDDLKVTAYILNHFDVSKGGIAYYILPQEVQDDLKITAERGKENVNLFANIEGIHVWCSITEDRRKNEWRVSIRSKKTAIDEVAAKFGGGGHAQASGAKLNSIAELPLLIAELDKLFI